MTQYRNLDPTDPKQTATAWSALIEPGDESARVLISLIGEEEALAWVLAEEPTPLPAAENIDRNIKWKNWHQRLRTRAQTLDVPQELQRAQKLGIQIITPKDNIWPKQLGILQDKEPLAFWTKGNLDVLQDQSQKISLVGARASTAYGNRIAEQIAWELASQNFTIVSGGAYGIDTAAHHGALASKKTKATIAVLCGGLGNLYPRGNTQLFSQITSQGLLISEVPPHWRPARWRFLERNRIISALSIMTVVVEAGIRSGAIATANRTSEMGKLLGVIPGPVTSTASAGCLKLLRETDATLVRGSTDILEELGYTPTFETNQENTNPFEERVLDAFPTTGIATTSELVRTSGLSVQEVEKALLNLQLRSQISRQGSAWLRLN